MSLLTFQEPKNQQNRNASEFGASVLWSIFEVICEYVSRSVLLEESTIPSSRTYHERKVTTPSF